MSAAAAGRVSERRVGGKMALDEAGGIGTGVDINACGSRTFRRQLWSFLTTARLAIPDNGKSPTAGQAVATPGRAFGWPLWNL